MLSSKPNAINPKPCAKRLIAYLGVEYARLHPINDGNEKNFDVSTIGK